MSETHAGKPAAAPEALAASALAFLRRYPPFDETEEEELRHVATRLRIGYYAAGTVILAAGTGAPEWLYIIKRGAVEVRQAAAAPGASVIAELAPGEYFSVGALLEKRASGPDYVAVRDTFCYQLHADDFQALLSHSARFREFATSYLTSLLRDSRKLLRMHLSENACEETSANRSLRSLVKRAPVCCGPETTIEDALHAMQHANIGSILIVGNDGTLEGIGSPRRATWPIGEGRVTTEEFESWQLGPDLTVPQQRKQSVQRRHS